MTALVARLDALHALAVAPFAVAVLVLSVGATWLAIQDEAKRDRQSLMSPETEAAREALHRAAWGGGER